VWIFRAGGAVEMGCLVGQAANRRRQTGDAIGTDRSL
jgi:hypothetical protein